MLTSVEVVALGVRAVEGSFFLSSGGHKLFDPVVRRKYASLMGSLGVGRTAWVVATGEMAGGMGLLAGVLPKLAALGLLLILLGAIYLDAWRTEVAERKPRDLADWIGKMEYCPEVLLAGGLLIVVLLGSGPWSLFGGL